MEDILSIFLYSKKVFTLMVFALSLIVATIFDMTKSKSNVILSVL